MVLVSSSRGFVFMEMLFVITAFAWIIIVYIRRLTSLGRPYVDVLGLPVAAAPVVPAVPPPSYGVPPATEMVLGSSAYMGQEAHNKQSTYAYAGEGYAPTIVDLILEGYEQLMLDYLPFFALGILNLVTFRCRAFCLTNVFIILCHVVAFNIARLARCPIPWMLAICKFSWAGWMMGWFINFWAAD